MKKNKIKVIAMIFLILLGGILLGIGFLYNNNENSNNMAIMIGLGAGMIGVAIAQLSTIKIYTNNPEFLKRKEIEVSDERNIVIKNKAKSKVYDIYNLIFPLIIFILVIANINLTLTIITILIYVLRIVLLTIYINKYNSEM